MTKSAAPLVRLIESQKDIAAATTADLIFTYNQLKGLAIKKFSSRAAGESQVANAILGAQQRAAHKGVAKGAEPKARDGKAEPSAKKGSARAPAVEKVATVPAPAPEALAAKRAKKPAAPVRNVYERIRFTEPDMPRRPHADSMRRKVLEAIRKRGEATIEQLTKDVGFNARAYVHKLAAVGWCEVVSVQQSLDIAK